MGLSRPEFHHSIKALTKGREWQRTGECYRLMEAEGWVELEAGREGLHQLGSLGIPQMQVALRSEGLTEAQWQSFLRQFEIAFQRGGG